MSCEYGIGILTTTLTTLSRLDPASLRITSALWIIAFVFSATDPVIKFPCVSAGIWPESQTWPAALMAWDCLIQHTPVTVCVCSTYVMCKSYTNITISNPISLLGEGLNTRRWVLSLYTEVTVDCSLIGCWEIILERGAIHWEVSFRCRVTVVELRRACRNIAIMTILRSNCRINLRGRVAPNFIDWLIVDKISDHTTDVGRAPQSGGAPECYF